VSKSNGFLQLRRGLWEHVRNGSLTHTGALVYIYMLTQADTRTGVWKGSAQCIAADLNIPKSTAKYALRGLDGRYIKRFTLPGRHACYPILLHKFLITQGQHVGLMLDALSSTNPRTLEFFKPDDEQQVVQQVVQQVAPQRIKENREERKNPHLTPLAPCELSTPTHNSLELETQEPSFQIFWEQWPRKQDKAGARRAWRKIPMSEYVAVTAGLQRWRKSEQWARGVIPHPATWLNAKRWMDEDIPQSGEITNGNINRIESFAKRTQRESQETLARVRRNIDALDDKVDQHLPEPQRNRVGDRGVCGSSGGSGVPATREWVS
jgi:hypothetical protein